MGTTLAGGQVPSWNGSSAGKTAAASNVDIVVTVHNALEHVQRCVASLLEHRGDSARIILVNDASDEPCTSWLKGVADKQPNVRLIEHAANVGYTRAINSALRITSAPYVILLNSDTVVTSGWLEGLLRCAGAAPDVGIVGPLSNAASWQSVPVVSDAGGFVVNQLPEGMTAEQVAAIVASSSRRVYPRTPVVNGFCFLIKRAVLEAVGPFDEQSFPQGYGEENDYCIRAAAAGFTLAIADDVFVYHAKSKSFGPDRRAELARSGSLALNRKHGPGTVDELSKKAKLLPGIDVVRQAVGAAFRDAQGRQASIDPLSLKVLFLLPVRRGGGGAHSVVQEVAAMRRLGVTANIAVLSDDYPAMCKVYEDVPGIAEILRRFTPDRLLELARNYDVVVATVYTTVELLERIQTAHPEVLPAYYVQDYEPLFFEQGSQPWINARASYQMIPKGVLFAKTAWVARQVAQHHGTLVRKVAPSLDHEIYYPAPLAAVTQIQIVAMVRPQTPRRGAARTMRVLSEVAKAYPDRVAIHLFGCESGRTEFQDLTRDFPFVNHSILSRREVATLLRRCHVFLDLSDYQAFGRTGLEAMASGCAVMVPAGGGTDEYAEDGKNALVVDSFNEAECVARLRALVEDPAEIRRLRREGLTTAAAFSTHRAVISELRLFAEALGVHRRGQQQQSARSRMLLAPELTAEGEVAWIGHSRLLHAWANAKVQRTWSADVVSESRLPEPGSADALVLQTGSPLADPRTLALWLTEWRQAGGKLLLDCTAEVSTEEPRSRAQKQELERSKRRLQWLASAADAVVVPSAELGEPLRAANPDVFVVPSYLDTQAWLIGLPKPTGPDVWIKRAGDPVRIGFIGTPSERGSLDLVSSAVARLEKELGSLVTVEVIGAYQKGKPPFGQRIGLPRKRSYPEYAFWLLRRVNWDIGLLPALDGEQAEDLGQRIFQYAALGLATLASDVPVARALVKHEETGLLVQNDPEAWYRALRRLVDEVPLRERLAARAQQELTQRFTADGNTQSYLDILETVRSRPRRTDVPPVPKEPGATGPKYVQRVLALANSESLELETLRRKGRKFARDPQAFFADSRSSLVRGVGSLLRKKS